MSDVTIVYPSATIGECNIYMKDINSPPEPLTTIVIGPLRCTVYPEGASKMSFGCTMWKSCKNEGCGYSQLGMDK